MYVFVLFLNRHVKKNTRVIALDIAFYQVSTLTLCVALSTIL